jgi:SPX domain protein involved in polyphosphate accumulation
LVVSYLTARSLSFSLRRKEMKFGKNLQASTLKEWRFYAVDYKAMKKALKNRGESDDGDGDDEFFRLSADAQMKLGKFYADRNEWAHEYMQTLRDRVAELRRVMAAPRAPAESSPPSIANDAGSVSETSSLTELDATHLDGLSSPTATSGGAFVENIHTLQKNPSFQMLSSRAASFCTKQEFLKQEYRRMGVSKEFKAFIYAKKSLATFERELQFLTEFFTLNYTAFVKILKKYDKRMHTNIQHRMLQLICAELPFLSPSNTSSNRGCCEAFQALQEETSKLIDEVTALKPHLPEGWENRKVYTIGCFE